MSPKPNSPSSSHELIGRVYPFSILDFGFIVGRAFGGTTHDGEKGFESKALSLITPPNCSGGAGICLPSIVTVELGAPGVPLISCALAEGGTTITVIATIALSRIYEFVFIVVGGLLVGKLAHYDVDRV